MEHARELRFGLSDVEAARLAVPAGAGEYEDTGVVELAKLVARIRNPANALSQSRKASASPACPLQLPGSGPSANTNSISGSAQSTDLSSPRSQPAKTDRTRSSFADATSCSQHGPEDLRRPVTG